jgi:hypothetical protein
LDSYIATTNFLLPVKVLMDRRLGSRVVCISDWSLRKGEDGIGYGLHRIHCSHQRREESKHAWDGIAKEETILGIIAFHEL